MSNWQSGSFHSPSSTTERPLSVDHPFQSTYHFTVSHGPNDSASLFEGKVNPNSVQNGQVGSFYMRNEDEVPANGRHTNWMKRANEGTSSDWEVIQEKIVYNVQEYGAKGDGSDDSDAIQRAFNAAKTNQTHYSMKQVYFPPGIYNISKPINIDFNALEVKGVYDATFIQPTDDANCTVFNISAGCYSHVFRDFIIWGGSKYGSFTDGNAIHHAGNNADVNLLIEHVQVGGVWNAIYIALGSNIHIEKCKFVGLRGSSVVSIGNGASYASYIKITNNWFDNNPSSKSLTLNKTRMIHIVSNDFNGTSGVVIGASNDIFIRGLWMNVSGAGDGSSVTFSGAQNIHITDCSFFGFVTSFVTGCKNAFIRGSQFEQLEIADSTDVLVSSILSPNINITNSQDITVSGCHAQTINLDLSCSNYNVANNVATINDLGADPKNVAGNISKLTPVYATPINEMTPRIVD